MIQFKLRWLFTILYVALYVVAQTIDEEFASDIENADNRSRINAVNSEDFRPRHGSFDNAEEEEEEDEELEGIRDDDSFVRNRKPAPRKEKSVKPNRRPIVNATRKKRINRLPSTGIENSRGSARKRPSQPDQIPRPERKDDRRKKKQQLDTNTEESESSDLDETEEPEDIENSKPTFVNTPINDPNACIVVALNNGAACLDPKSFGKGNKPLPSP
ncbi:hypothetical protein K7432_000962 [Basidiobolus ranarum]|uniref:Uncharacterized protein n=1 Tax=Basidiobolus ranarum TaxID=34480 RepID=A0ABR2X3Q2_9FUNG